MSLQYLKFDQLKEEAGRFRNYCLDPSVMSANGFQQNTVAALYERLIVFINAVQEISELSSGSKKDAYAIDVVGDIADNICFDAPKLAVFEEDTLTYFKQRYEWIETQNKVHVYFPELCLVFSCFGKKKDSKGKRIRLFDRDQRKHIEEKYLKL